MSYQLNRKNVVCFNEMKKVGFEPWATKVKITISRFFFFFTQQILLHSKCERKKTLNLTFSFRIIDV